MTAVIAQGMVLGGNRIGTFFDDMAAVGGWPAQQQIARIVKIEASCGEIIDGIAISYLLKSGDTKRIVHGDDWGVGKTWVVDFKATEVLSSVQGRQEFRSSAYGQLSFTQLSFTLLDLADPSKPVLRTLAGPVGSATEQASFQLVGPIIAFAGYYLNVGTKPYLYSLSPFTLVSES